jgi:hypothetical protein
LRGFRPTQCAAWRGYRRYRSNVHVAMPFQCAAEAVWPASSPRLLSGLKVAPASPRPSPAMRLPAIHEMDRNAQKRQADYPIRKKSRSENQHRACQENDPLDHSEEGRLSSLRECDSQLSLYCILHLPNPFSLTSTRRLNTTHQGFGSRRPHLWQKLCYSVCLSSADGELDTMLAKRLLHWRANPSRLTAAHARSTRLRPGLSRDRVSRPPDHCH